MMMWVCFRSRNTSRWSPSVLFHTSNQVKLWTWSQKNLESNKILFHSKLFWTNATFPLDVWNKCPTVCLNKMLTYPQAGLVWLCEVTRGQNKIQNQDKLNVMFWFFFSPQFLNFPLTPRTCWFKLGSCVEAKPRRENPSFDISKPIRIISGLVQNAVTNWRSGSEGPRLHTQMVMCQDWGFRSSVRHSCVFLLSQHVFFK